MRAPWHFSLLTQCLIEYSFRYRDLYLIMGVSVSPECSPLLVFFQRDKEAPNRVDLIPPSIIFTATNLLGVSEMASVASTIENNSYLGISLLLIVFITATRFSYGYISKVQPQKARFQPRRKTNAAGSKPMPPPLSCQSTQINIK